MALTTTLNRLIFKRYAREPWLVFPATRFLESKISGMRLFEFGSGMSTLWFSEKCRQVVSVESNDDWFRSIAAQLSGRANAQVILAKSKDDYLRSISSTGMNFDVVVVDGSYRSECIDKALLHLNATGILVVDNTDAHPELSTKISSLFDKASIHHFRGWAPGNLHPGETTIVMI